MTDKQRAFQELISRKLLEPAKGYLNEDVALDDCIGCKVGYDVDVFEKGTEVYLSRTRVDAIVTSILNNAVSLKSEKDIMWILEIPTKSIDWNYQNPHYMRVFKKYNIDVESSDFIESFYQYLNKTIS
ncbi:hypothetical protein [Sulfurimonas sp.]|uniref:hypothetical protein n=1 Tax=Sulfurimonas sp. TaxID=2022749 RepID=UPI003D095C25